MLGGPGAGPSGRAGRGPQHNHPPDQAVAEAVAETNKCDQHCTTLSIETSPTCGAGSRGRKSTNCQHLHLQLKPFNGPLFSHVERIVQIEHIVWDTN